MLQAWIWKLQIEILQLRLNNMKNLKRMIPFSALLSKEGDIDDFDEFIDHSNNPEEIYCEEQEFYNPISCLKESDIELLNRQLQTN